MTTDLHVTPVRDLVDHDETRGCWCGPVVQRECPECYGEDEDCWRCGGEGWIEDDDPEYPSIVCHNAVDGRE